MDILKVTGGNKELQMRYISEVSADNVKAKERISTLKAEIDSIELHSPKSKIVARAETAKGPSPSAKVKFDSSIYLSSLDQAEHHRGFAGAR